jgi:signal transduction histidine kinase
MTTHWSQTELETGHASRLVNSVLRWLPSALIMVGEHNDILHINEKARSILRLEATESRYKSILDLPYYLNDLKRLFLAEGDFEAAREEVAISLPGEAETRTLGYTLRCETIPELGPIMTFVFSDITQVLKDRKAKDQMRLDVFQAKKMGSMASLIAGVAEELHNPFIALSMTQSMLEQSLQELKPLLGEAALNAVEGQLEQAIGQLTRLDEITGKANTLVNQLIRYSRPVRLDADKVELDTYLEDLIQNWKWSLFNDSTTELLFEGNTPNLSLSVDQSKIEQVLYHLVKNGVEAVKPKQAARVTIRTSVENYGANHRPMALIKITDNGVGIKPEVAERIFDPFYTTKGAEATGLGLSTSFQTIERHGGLLTLESELGFGSTFIVALPLESHDKEDG